MTRQSNDRLRHARQIAAVVIFGFGVYFLVKTVAELVLQLASNP